MDIEFNGKKLCAGAARKPGNQVTAVPAGPTGLRINAQIILGDAPRLRALEMLSFDRGNRSTTVSFTARREFTDIAEAQVFALEHVGEFLGRGTLKMTAKSDRRTVTRTIANAVGHRADARADGVSVYMSYNIKGGAIAGGKL